MTNCRIRTENIEDCIKIGKETWAYLIPEILLIIYLCVTGVSSTYIILQSEFAVSTSHVCIYKASFSTLRIEWISLMVFWTAKQVVVDAEVERMQLTSQSACYCKIRMLIHLLLPSLIKQISNYPLYGTSGFMGFSVNMTVSRNSSCSKLL